MILARDNPNYLDLPGLTVVLGGMWIALPVIGVCNQYITQRALGASLPTARNGLLLRLFSEVFMPIIVVLPGIAAYVLYQHGSFHQDFAILRRGTLDQRSSPKIRTAGRDFMVGSSGAGRFGGRRENERCFRILIGGQRRVNDSECFLPVGTTV